MAKFVLAGVMGWPVAHSRSPAIHGHWIQQHGLAGAYVLLPVDPEQLAQAVQGLAALGFAGCNVTIPHKLAAMQLVDRVDPAARRIGAINTIVVEADGSTSGYNNDAAGYIESLRDAEPGWRASVGPVAVMGCGGGARAVIVGLLDDGATEIRVCNRSFDKAQALAQDMGAAVQAVAWEQRHDALGGAALLVNTTNQGMHGQSALALSLDALPREALVSDLVYVPLETPLLAAARQRGHRTVDGLGMLLHQARPSFNAWFGVMPEVTPQLRALIVSSL